MNSILHPPAHHRSANRKSAEPHIAEKCVICKQWAIESYELCALVFARMVTVYESVLSLPEVSFYCMRSHIKVSIIYHFFFTFSYRWKQMTGKLHPVWQMAGWHRSMGCPPANCLLLKEKTGTDRLPLPQLLSMLISQRDCSQLQGRRMEKTLGCVRAHVDGVKGKMTSHSNELLAIICYFTEVGVYHAGDQWLGHCCIIQTVLVAWITLHKKVFHDCKYSNLVLEIMKSQGFVLYNTYLYYNARKEVLKRNMLEYSFWHHLTSSVYSTMMAGTG